METNSLWVKVKNSKVHLKTKIKQNTLILKQFMDVEKQEEKEERQQTVTMIR